MVLRKVAKTERTDKVSNEEVLQRIKENEMVLQKQEMSFAKHLLRGSSGDSALQILKGKLEGTTAQGRRRRMWIDDIKHWMKFKTCEEMKRTA